MRVSVIVPAFNEEKFIASVIDVVKRCNIVDEIIVVDNNSTDNTSNVALNCGVITIFCKE